MASPSAEYDDAMAAFRLASKAHYAVTVAYRAKTVDDRTFLASRARLDAAGRVADDAETRLINSRRPRFPGRGGV